MRTAALLLLGLALAGCQSAVRQESAPVRARFYLESADAATGQVTLPQSSVHISVQPKPVFTEFDLVHVEIARVELGPCLEFRFTRAAARDLYRLTVANQGRRLVLVVDGAPVGAQRTDQPLDHGVVRVFAEMPDSALPALVTSLNKTSAALQPAAIKR
jgi:preprotein translocase subunit SecD